VEIWLKKSLGSSNSLPKFEETLAKEEFENLPLTAAHTRGVARSAVASSDPFDRMLIAQAKAADLTSADADGDFCRTAFCSKGF